MLRCYGSYCQLLKVCSLPAFPPLSQSAPLLSRLDFNQTMLFISYCFAVFKVLLYKLFHTVLAKSLGGVSLYSFFIDIETKALRSDPGIYTSNSSPLVTRSCILSIISPLTELCARILWGESGI